MSPNRLLVHASQIFAIEIDGARAGHFKSQQKTQDRRLARAGGPHHGDKFSRLKVQIYIVQDERSVGVVAKRDVADFNLTPQVAWVALIATKLRFGYQNRLGSFIQRNDIQQRRHGGADGHTGRNDLDESGIESQESRQVQLR